MIWIQIQVFIDLIKYAFIIIFSLQIQMVADIPQKIDILSRRNSQYRAKFNNAHEHFFYTFLYEIEFTQKNNVIYQFEVDTTPEIPKDSAYLYRLIYKKIHKDLKQKIQDVIQSGTMIWGFENLKKAAVFQAEFTQEGKQYKFDILVKPVKSWEVSEMMKDQTKRKILLQIFNSKTKGTLRNHMKYIQLGTGKYFNPKPEVIEALGLDIRRGFKLTLCPIANELLMQIDVCSRISRSQNFSRELSNASPQSANQIYKGVTVITRYGKIRTYRIQSINYDLDPRSTFFSEKQAGKISYAQYYQTMYGIVIKNLKQPLIYAIQRYENKIGKDGILVENPIYVYLIPELVSLTGMSDADKANHNAMKQIAPWTKLEPKQRAKQNQSLIKCFNEDQNNKIIKIKGHKTGKGFVLNDVKIQLKSTVNTKDGRFMFKNQIRNPAKFKDWVFVYSLSNRPDQDNNQADRAVQLFQSCSKAFGIQVSDPGFITVKGRNVQDWKAQIDKDVKDNGNPQIVVLFFQKNQQRYYGELKRYLTKQLKVPSQAIRRRTLSNQQAARNMSAASKIILQMNAKLGLPLWEVPESIKVFGKKNIMYGAYSVSKGTKGFTLAFVGTIDQACSKVYSQAVVGIKRKEDIPETTFDSIFKNWAKNYYKTTKGVPDMIIIYRQGLAEAQIQKYVRREIQSLQKTIVVIGQKVKIQNYNPQLLFVGVNKKISMRFYNMNGSDRGGKFIPNLSNPDSGSVIVEDMSVGNLIDFHLAAQKVTQGTCTPTQYIVIHKNFNDLSIQALAQFTYGQCFNYYNWTGAVRVPACLQCADKLAKLVGQSIQEDLTGLGDLDNKYHFL